MSNYLQASDVFVPDFLALLGQQGLSLIDPRRTGVPIFQFDEKGNPTAMRLRARTAKAYKTWSGGHNMPLGGVGAELWIPIPQVDEGDPSNLRKFMTPEYSGNLPKESGQAGKVGQGPNQQTYGSGWDPDKSSIPSMGSTGSRGPESEDEVPVTPAMPEDVETQEDKASDKRINDKVEWGSTPDRSPSHLDINIKNSSFKLQHLCNWLMKNGHEYEATCLSKEAR